MLQRYGIIPFDGSDIKDPSGEFMRADDVIALLRELREYVHKTAADVPNVDVDPCATLDVIDSAIRDGGETDPYLKDNP